MHFDVYIFLPLFVVFWGDKFIFITYFEIVVFIQGSG